MNFPDASLPPILLVDDSDDDIFFLRHRLRSGGITNPIVTFSATADALAYLRCAPVERPMPGLLFTDIRMPHGDGFSLIGAIRSRPEWDPVKVVAITCSNDPRDLQRALRIGVDGYLIKFPTPDLLADFINHGPWFARTGGIREAAVTTIGSVSPFASRLLCA
ncbi:MAG TPA: response regulator [Opitutaceae bacterium]|nr:response regulator [Opitutaceae bacterium]